MAVKLVTKINRYIGIAAEIAAIDLTGIPAGSTFFESDTGILKTLNSAGALVSAPSESVQVAGSLPAGTNVIGVIGIDQAANAVQLLGSIPEYGWIDGDTEPTPTGFAFGAKVDSTTGNITCMYWNGIAWVEVE